MTTSRRPPTTLTAAGDSLPSASTGKLSLVWLFPRPTDPMLELELRSGEEWIIGRDEDVAIHRPDPNVSRRHARVRREDADTYLLDLGSRNGTRVNGRVTKAARLALGDVVRIGDTVGLVTNLVGRAIE